jgi:hypothetical protein
MKSLICFLAALVFPAIALAGDPPVVEQLRRDLVGKSFALRVQIAGSTCLQDQGLSFSTSRLVDTEIDDYTVRYYLRTDRFMNVRRCSPSAGIVPSTMLGGMYLAGRQVLNMHPERSNMSIKQIDAKPDRIELQLTAVGQSGDQAYGKIKLMLGKGNESQSLEQLEMSLARVLEVPRIRDLVQARTTYDSIESEIRTLEVSLATELATRQKVLNATRLLTLYDQEAGAVSRLNQIAFSPVQVPGTSVKVEQTKRALAGFQQQAEREKIDTALNQYATATTQMKTDCERFPKGNVNTRSELNAQISAVDTARQDLNKFESARRELVNLGQAVAQSDEDYSTKCSASCDALSQTFSKKEEAVRTAEAIAADAERQRQEKEAQLKEERIRAQQLERVEEGFRNLNKQKATLDAKLLTALGGPDEYAIYSVYRNLLAEMIQNRQQAQALGSRSAEQEMQALIARLQKLQQ